MRRKSDSSLESEITKNSAVFPIAARRSALRAGRGGTRQQRPLLPQTTEKHNRKAPHSSSEPSEADPRCCVLKAKEEDE